MVMDLHLFNRCFLITGGTSGLGLGVSRTLLKEGASIIAVGTDQEKLERLKSISPKNVTQVMGDLFELKTADLIVAAIGGQKLDGVFLNASGPPAMPFMETSLQNWDTAYHHILRWKVNLVQKLLPIFRQQGHGRILFSESISVKQPIKDLVLSNSMRLAVTGMAKTLANEVAEFGITVNVIGTGYHKTGAMNRLYARKMKAENLSMENAVAVFEKEVPVGKMGDEESFGNLIAWLFSPLSFYITGQTISVDGGMVKGVFG
jgi:3-oxoacyl-[acyl-carrier protein] reductase